MFFVAIGNGSSLSRFEQGQDHTNLKIYIQAP